MYQLKLDKRVLSDLDKIPSREAAAIHKKFELLKINPRPVGCKKLRGVKNLYRIRQGVYRILYQIFDDHILIVIIAVKHRKFAYQNLK